MDLGLTTDEGLPQFMPGSPLHQEISAERLNSVSQGVKRRRIFFGDDFTYNESNDGTTADLLPFYSSDVPLHPYKGQASSTADNPGVTVIYGMHNNIVPTIDGLPLVVTPTVDNPAPILILTATPSTYAVYVQCDFNASGFVTSAEINFTDPLITPVPANMVNPDGSGTGYDVIFSATVAVVDGGFTVAIADVVISSRNCRICGDNIDFWT